MRPTEQAQTTERASRADRALKRLLPWLNLAMFTVAIGLGAGYRLGSTALRAEASVSTRVYAVGDILSGEGNPQAALSNLLGHIHQSIEPASWNAPDRKLVGYAAFAKIEVQSTASVHAQIDRFLTDIRQLQAEFRHANQLSSHPINAGKPSCSPARVC